MIKTYSLFSTNNSHLMEFTDSESDSVEIYIRNRKFVIEESFVLSKSDVIELIELLQYVKDRAI